MSDGGHLFQNKDTCGQGVFPSWRHLASCRNIHLSGLRDPGRGTRPGVLPAISGSSAGRFEGIFLEFCSGGAVMGC